MDFDAIIVGAGPAGSRTARDLARQGIRVALLEEHAEAGSPVHCSGLVTDRTLAEAGVDEQIVRNRIRGVHAYVDPVNPVTLGGDRTYAHVIDRRRLDELLAQQAESAGATLLWNTRLRGVRRVDSHVEFSVDGEAGARTLTAWLVVGADGSNSVVARTLDFPAYNETVVVIGGEASLQPRSRDHVEVFLGSTFAPGWFGWTIPIDDHTVRVGIGGVSGVNPRHLLKGLIENVPHLRAARVLRLRGHLIPVRQRERIYAANALLVGDAAGHAKASSGGGIWTSLVAGRTAAAVATMAFNEGDFSSSSLSRYQTVWQRGVGRDLDHARSLRDAFLRLQPNDWQRLAAIGRDPAVRSLLARHGDIDLPARAFARLLGPGHLPRLLPRVPLHLWPTALRLGAQCVLHHPERRRGATPA